MFLKTNLELGSITLQCLIYYIFGRGLVLRLLLEALKYQKNKMKPIL